MRSNYKMIGELVDRIDERNTDGSINTLVGVSIDKCFIKSVANTVGTDLTKYKIVRKNDFAVSLMQVSRDQRIPVAIQTEYDAAIMSPAYPIFRVKNEKEIIPEYLDMWFKRPEFDREASFIAVGGVRGSMPWDDFARMQLPVPSYEEQLQIVNNYKAISERIRLKQKINDNLYKLLLELRPEWGEKRLFPDGVEVSDKDKKELKPIETVRLVMTRNKDDEPELFNMLGTKDDRKELDRQFKNIKSNFKIAIVVDMWLTGFDVPFLDTMYIDKPIQQHTLIQTISRVNRVYEGKDKGLIVDYIGIKKNLNLAIAKYTNFESSEFESVEQSITIVRDQLEVLGQMFNRFNNDPFFNGTPKEQLECLNRAVEYIQITEELELRYMAAVKRMKQAFDLCVSSEELTEKEKDLVHFYIAVRSVLFKLTRGDAPDISRMNAKVQKMVEDAIESDGIEELFETGKRIEIDVFNDEYLEKISKIKLPNTRIKILQKLLSQAIDEFKKVNKIKGVEFSERLKQVVDNYNNRSRDETFANEVLDDVAGQLAELLHQLKEEKKSFEGMGIDFEEKAFFDILAAVAKKYEFEYPQDKMVELSKEIKKIVDDKSRYTDWSTRDDIKANLQVDLIILLDQYGYPPVTIDDVYKEVLEQAENFKKYANMDRREVYGHKAVTYDFQPERNLSVVAEESVKHGMKED